MSNLNMNCVYSILEFLVPKTKRQLSRKYVNENMPTSVTISGFKQLRDFNRWFQLFDQGKLLTVRFHMPETKLIESLRSHFPGAAQADGFIVDDTLGHVPASVKRVEFACGYDVNSYIDVSNGVEEVVMGFYGGYRINLPSTIKKLHFTPDFEGVLTRWPEALEEVIIEGWEQGDERVHHPITRLPDTVKTITLYEQLHIVIEHLPSSLETFVYQGYGEDGQDYDEDYDEDYESYAERNY